MLSALIILDVAIENGVVASQEKRSIGTKLSLWMNLPLTFWRESKVSISVVRDPELLKIAHAMGFKGKILIDTTEKDSFTFLSDNCAMCDEPWTVKVSLPGESGEGIGQLYLCDAHLERARDKGSMTAHIMLRRIAVE